ncbi:hypothetical protein [Dehalococcoides mccartyi]|uniref:hypothetical protein n=1 Tax=Dehalococcoides mccartyi TaxID=61435 RepID=UPI0002B7623D|nr:hypothetical protein [Dehalococcoides mccartyi]AGG06835.1 hypothetical protein dcmb_1236 [Dehalococcoides mccartyi DCMB5]
MSDKRMLIVPAELVRRIDENRGDLSQADFLNYLIDSQLGGESRKENGISNQEFEALKQDVKKLLEKSNKSASREELVSFQEDTKKLLKSFVDFFGGYGLELGKGSSAMSDLEALSKLGSTGSKDETPGGEVKLKWK